MLPKMKDLLYQSDTSKKRSTGSGYQMLTPMKKRLVLKLFPSQEYAYKGPMVHVI
jgi:hypothetical protein